MSYRCDNCGKGKISGQRITHKPGVAGGQWKKKAPKSKRVFLPNLQTYRGKLHGVFGKWRLCTKCLKKMRSLQTNLAPG